MAEALLGWYETSRRDLPWRRTRDPYAVWVSEVMLQQTQAATVTEYYGRWMQRLPDVRALARAGEPTVLHLWQGLGYYSRARALRLAARAVVQKHSGRLPSSVEQLRALPGLGAYSAGAIASIAFNQKEPAVDANVTRVLCRLFELRGDPRCAPLKGRLWTLARELLPSKRPGDFNQALMELGATVCKPRRPACGACPLASWCRARKRGEPEALPERRKRPPITAVHMAAALVKREASAQRVLVIRLPKDAPRWAGMWQFPCREVGALETAEQAAERAVRDAVGLKARAEDRIITVSHSVTRYRIKLEAFVCRRTGKKLAHREVSARWCLPSELERLAMPSAHRRIARALTPKVFGP
jgi:A/G-specific adenine glycosylase